MIRLLAIVSIALMLYACGNNQKANTLEDTLAEANKAGERSTICFRRLQGQANQDTTMLKLEINGEQVSGTFQHIPFEKDSRKGTIEGTRKGDIIKANWVYMQEGMNDTLAVEFKLSGDELLQKTYGYEKETGREILTDTSSFSIKFTKINCN